jgi:hypothetical protein
MQGDRTKTIVTGVSILLITTGLFFVGRAILRRLQEKKQDELSQTAGDEGSGDTQLTPSEEQEAKKYNPANDVKYIYDKIGGWNFLAPYKEINGKIASLTDAKLKKLAQAYKSKHKITLYRQLDEEWDDFDYGNLYESSMNRLVSLGLT